MDPDIAAAKKDVEQALLDPNSVQYDGLFKAETGAVCGTYNAKNKYGGYSGRKAFVYYRDSEYYISAHDKETTSHISSLCGADKGAIKAYAEARNKRRTESVTKYCKDKPKDEICNAQNNN